MSKAKSGLREQVRRHWQGPGWRMCMERGLTEGGGCSLPHTQDLAALDVHALTPLSPEVISRQATINIGGCAAAVNRQRN